MTIHDEFDAWLKQEGIKLLDRQNNAAHAVLRGVMICGSGRASGKTFTLKTVERFLTEASSSLSRR